MFTHGIIWPCYHFSMSNSAPKPDSQPTASERATINALRSISKAYESAGETMSTLSQPSLRIANWWTSGIATSAVDGNYMYKARKVQFEQVIASLPEPYRTQVREKFKNPNELTQWAHSAYSEFAMRFQGAQFPVQSELYRNYNHALLREDAEGKLQKTDAMALRKLLPSSEDGYGQQEWPQIVLTANHAYADKVEDITQITHGVEALVHHAFGDKAPRPLARMKDIGDSKRTGKLLVVAACDTKRNAFLNGADLIERLLTRREELDSGNSVATVRNASDAAHRLAKTIMVMLVQNPEELHPEDPYTLPSDLQDPEYKKAFADRVRNTRISAGSSLRLRDDAEEVARHITLFGYSLSGNTVSDAMRLVARELSSQIAAGHDRYQVMQDGSGMDICHGRGVQSPWNVANILQRIRLISVAPGELPLSEDHKKLGIRRVNIINRNDLIASHFWHDSQQWEGESVGAMAQGKQKPGDDYVMHDNLYRFEGEKTYMGHAPKSALGFRRADGTYEKGDLYKTGGGKREAPIIDRLKTMFAPMVHKAAIADIRFLDGADISTPRVVLEPSPGTSRNVFNDEVIGQINKAFRKAGLHNVTLRYDVVNQLDPTYREYQLFCEASPHAEAASTNPLLNDPNTISKVKKAFESLRNESNNGIFVSNAVLDSLTAHWQSKGGKAGGRAVADTKSRKPDQGDDT